ncbi:MFS transporter [Sulfobacillus thermosulfidooxidans]|uniref:MFS transporter n=1 Tax=Sulfobacillus thermosulfidooxidans TaxID=28034 RepID=UPI000403F030|nr:MFS transporter [Sulfobacillus thermosulfidooxidans]
MKLGIKANRTQFFLLVLLVVFVGALLGSERTIVPVMAEDTFHLTNGMLILSFIATFGLSKAIVNLFAGHWSDRVGRKKVLMWGWIIGLPVPVLLAFAPNWNWVIGANILLGINQGLAWTMTSVGKIDLVGPQGRGLAVGIDEGAGYLGLAASGWVTALLAAKFGLRPIPFVLAEVVALLGLLSTITLLRETREFALLEHTQSSHAKSLSPLDLKDAFAETTWKNPGLSTLSLDGQINKWSDTLMWGIMPLYLASEHVSLPQIGLVAGVYAGTWGLAQFGTGLLSDHIGRRKPILMGLALNAIGVLGLYLFHHVGLWVLSAGLGGLGTALLYPNLSSAVSDIAPPAHRGGITGVFRLWRDGGYAVAALLLGAISTASSLHMTILVVGILLLMTTILSWWRLPETLPRLVVHQHQKIG